MFTIHLQALKVSNNSKKYKGFKDCNVNKYIR